MKYLTGARGWFAFTMADTLSQIQGGNPDSRFSGTSQTWIHSQLWNITIFKFGKTTISIRAMASIAM